MNPSKRTLSSAASERCAKTAKISHESDKNVAEEHQPDPCNEENKVQVTVKLRSTTKAEWNDPEPLGDWDKHCEVTPSGSGDASDRPAPSSEDGGATGRPTQPPTPPQPNSSTATDSQKRSSPVDGSPPHGNGPVTGSAEERNSNSPR